MVRSAIGVACDSGNRPGFGWRLGPVERSSIGMPEPPETKLADVSIHLAIDILIVLFGVAMLLKRDRLARFIADWQQSLARAFPRLYFGPLGRIYKSEKAWRIFIPLFGLAFVLFGSLYLWRRAY
jgi:hypothetical protein